MPRLHRDADEARVTTLFDIRQRRGCGDHGTCGPNAQRLQRLLAEASIASTSITPSSRRDTELRNLQYRHDDRRGVGKHNPRVPGPAYVPEYTEEILDLVGVEPIVKQMPVQDRRADVRGGDHLGLSPLAGGRAVAGALRVEVIHLEPR